MADNLENVENVNDTETLNAVDMPPIPYLVHEADMARLERVKDQTIAELKEEVANTKEDSKKFFKGMIAAFILMALMLTGFLIYEAQFDTYSYQQDGAWLNNINTGEQGDVFGSEAAREAQAERQG